MEFMPSTSGTGAGAQIPQCPGDTNHVDGFMNTSDMYLNDDNIDNPVSVNLNDRLDYQFDESSVISPNSVCDNAIDPDMYFSHSRQPHCGKSSLASPCRSIHMRMNASTPFSHVPSVENCIVPPLNPSNSNHIEKVPDLERQMSLNVVMEVLRSACPIPDGQPNIDLGIFVPPAHTSALQDDCYCAQPSPSYSECSVQLRNRTLSEYIPSLPDMLPLEEYSRTRAYSADPGCMHHSRSSEVALPFRNYAEGVTSAPILENNSPAIANTLEEIQVPSSTNALRSVCLELPENSLDMEGMLEDFLLNTDPKVQSIPTPESSNDALEVGIEATVEIPCSQSLVPSPKVAPATAALAHNVVDLTEDSQSTSQDNSSVTVMKRTPSYKRKRSQNNKACKESRKKRKMQRKEAEVKVSQLTEENDELRRKIQDLEVEVRKAKEDVFAQMKRKA